MDGHRLAWSLTVSRGGPPQLGFDVGVHQTFGGSEAGSLPC
jgi:hypothetical protein